MIHYRINIILTIHIQKHFSLCASAVCHSVYHIDLLKQMVKYLSFGLVSDKSLAVSSEQVVQHTYENEVVLYSFKMKIYDR